jgi:acetyltransferase-like isoleucine patch superfamily enzyme
MAILEKVGATVQGSIPRPALDVLRLLVGLLPASRTKSRMFRLLGWDVHDDARVAINLLWRIDSVSLAAESWIGSFNVIRDLLSLELGRGALVGHWIWISAARPLRGLSEDGASLRVGDDAVITSRHVLDASGGITIGRHSAIGGVRTTVLSHQVDLVRCVQTAAPVVIGDHVLVSSNCRITAGVRIASYTLVASSAAVVGDLPDSYRMYGGVPAKEIGELPPSAGYFTKTTNSIGTGA